MIYSNEQLRRDQNITSVVLGCLSVAAIWFFYHRGEILLSGDAVAHINISRRIFDSRTPGPLQLGTVWLPLQHILTVPFIIPRWLWQSGIGGSVVSVIAYIIGGRGILRLAGSFGSRGAAWLALAVYALNPNLLYVQSTALNEPLSLAAAIWAIVYFSEFMRAWRLPGLPDRMRLGRLLLFGTLALAAAMLTRYDGWFLAAMCWAMVFLYIGRVLWRKPSEFQLLPKRMLALCIFLTVLVPAVWLAYNYFVFGNALDFLNGPYSAKAIAERTTSHGAPPYPGYHSISTAALYFQKTAKLNLGEPPWAGIIFALAIVGSGWALLRREPAIVLLWSVLLFYSLSIAHGGVPIFIPVWWPFSYYNTRYGLQLLPALACGVGLLIFFVSEVIARKTSRRLLWTAAWILTLVSYVAAWRAIPICLRETRANGAARTVYEAKLADALKGLRSSSTYLIYAGDHSGAIQRAGIPFRYTINEGNYRIWQSALLNPAYAADYVVAAEGDPVAAAVREKPAGLEPVAQIESPGQPPTVVYRSLLHQ
jgi:hypothetical protein